MSFINTITIADLSDQDSVLKMISEIQNHGTNFSLVQNGVEVARVVPVDEKNDHDGDTVSDELTAVRLAALKNAEELSKRIAKLWKSEETATEAVANDRRSLPFQGGNNLMCVTKTQGVALG
jgi:hypothetical protein